VNEVDNALSQLREIQTRLAESTRFRGIAPDSNAVSGVLVLLVAAAQGRWPQWLQPDPTGYVAVWATVISVVWSIVALEAVARARRIHGDMAPTLLASAAQRALPFAVAGVVTSCAIVSFARDSVWLLPGLWQIFIGLLGFSAMGSLPRNMIWASAWYFFAGTAVLGLAGWSGELSPWMMGIPMGLGQLGVALILNAADVEADREA